MNFADSLATAPVMLSQGSVYERVRRDPSMPTCPEIGHAALIYDEASAVGIADVYRSYMSVALEARLPMLAMAGTWRTNPERVARSAFRNEDVNGDQVRLLRSVAESLPARGPSCPIFVAGVLGPKGDAFNPAEGLSRGEAQSFHGEQAHALAAAEADCIVALTLPALEEARGLAAVMASAGLPYLVSFVVEGGGRLLDGTPLSEAVQIIDNDESRAPIGYMANCVHPTVLEAALATCPPGIRTRIVGLRANTSALHPSDLDGSKELLTEDPRLLAEHMLRLWRNSGIKILGGCCGTDTSHIAALAQLLGEQP